MNPIQLEIFQDDAMAAPRLSRVLPAVLYNYVPEHSYIEFCNTIDELLRLAAVDYKCRADRFRWWSYGILFWFYWFFAIFLSYCLAENSGEDDYIRIHLPVFIVSIVICPIYFFVIRTWINSSTGVVPATDTVRRIREECDAMTYRTPYASFHLVTTSPYTPCGGGHLYENPIVRIEVSVVATGLDVGKVYPLPTVNTSSAVTSDYQSLEVV